MKTMPRPQTAGTWLVERIREAIITGQMPAGSAVRQEELAEAYGVSRMPVRQALDILSAEGWIDHRPHRGAVVAALDPEEAIELFDLRLALETLAIERSFPRLNDLQMAGIDKAWRDLRRRDGEVLALHQQFHIALYAAAGPRIQRVILQQLNAVQRHLRFEFVVLHVEEADDNEHAILVQAAKDRDVKRGVEILREHLIGAGRGVASNLRNRHMESSG